MGSTAMQSCDKAVYSAVTIGMQSTSLLCVLNFGDVVMGAFELFLRNFLKYGTVHKLHLEYETIALLPSKTFTVVNSLRDLLVTYFVLDKWLVGLNWQQA